MKKELKPLFLVSTAVGLWAISFFAFSRKIRKEIGDRDKWTCQGCGKRYEDGWMLHAAHNPNKHNSHYRDYNKPESGSMRCIDCHIKQHEKGTILGWKLDGKAVRMLSKTERRTKTWLQQNRNSNQPPFEFFKR